MAPARVKVDLDRGHLMPSGDAVLIPRGKMLRCHPAPFRHGSLQPKHQGPRDRILVPLPEVKFRSMAVPGHSRGSLVAQVEDNTVQKRMDFIVITSLLIKDPAQPGDGPEVFVGEIQQRGPQSVDGISSLLAGVTDFYTQPVPDPSQVVFHASVQRFSLRFPIHIFSYLRAHCLHQPLPVR